MTTTTTHPPVPLPPGALKAEEWQPDSPLAYRIFEGEQRELGDGISVWTHGVQYQDGRIDDGTGEHQSEAPGISVDGVRWEKNLSSATGPPSRGPARHGRRRGRSVGDAMTTAELRVKRMQLPTVPTT